MFIILKTDYIQFRFLTIHRNFREVFKKGYKDSRKKGMATGQAIKNAK